jgi:iron-sulfur cluster assembly accessory protein
MKLFEITDVARLQMEKLLKKNPDKWAVSLIVNGGGCAGFKYEWKFIDSKDDVSKDDYTEEWEGGRFVVDEMSLLYVSGTKIDWKEELFGSQFEISNPNSTSACGCGESFGV